MRTLQLFGLMLALAAIILGYMSLTPIDSQTSESAASAVGLVILFGVLPMFAVSALMLLPSSLMLFNLEVRRRTFFSGPFWLSLWKLNLVICIGYIAVAIYVAYLWFTQAYSEPY